VGETSETPETSQSFLRFEGKLASEGEIAMYYRLEAEHNNISIRHVETDREVGYVCPGKYVYPDHSGTFHGCRIFNEYPSNKC
jgi:hypothetical protein